jgi:2-oxo-3-hexenedioate decarboxylase
VEPRSEPEIVIGLASKLRHGAGRDAVAAAMGWAAVGFEIVQCHYANWEMTPADAIADGGLHGLLVVGERRAVDASRAVALASLEVELSCHDEAMATGVGANALGGPVEAVTWLLRLPGVEALPVGSIITTGTLTNAFPVAAGDAWRAFFRCRATGRAESVPSGALAGASTYLPRCIRKITPDRGVWTLGSWWLRRAR